MSSESPAPDVPPAAPPPPPLPSQNPSLWKRIAAYLRPYTHQTWLNVQVWVSPLMNPAQRARQIRYWSRESREKAVWEVALPPQCWQCGTEEGVRARVWERTVRSFEYPLPIIGVTLGFALPGLWLSWWLGWKPLAIMAALWLVGGIVAMVLKSWPEHIRTAMSTCDAHADAMSSPDVVVDQGELFLFAPTVELAEAAREELQEQRRQTKRRWSGYGDGGASAAPSDRSDHAAPESEPTGPYRPKIAPPSTPDLPPIKLAGDDDEDEQASSGS